MTESEALAALLGPQTPGVSASTVTRLKGIWQEEYQQWRKRSLAGKHYVYAWAGGVYFNIRLEGGQQCILVLLGATAEGNKELIAIQDGGGRVSSPGRNCCWIAKAAAWRSHRVSRWGTAPWDSGKRCGRFGRKPRSSAAGCTRRRMYVFVDEVKREDAA